VQARIFIDNWFLRARMLFNLYAKMIKNHSKLKTEKILEVAKIIVEIIEQAIPLLEQGYVEAADYEGVKILKIRKPRLGV
jgi:hypothetical protein